MRFLVLTTLFPNSEMPSHGIFVENRLRAFLRKYDADVKVIAPVPWFPFQSRTFGQYGKWARVPEIEVRHGIEVFHPRYAIPPKLGMSYAPHALARCMRKSINEIRSSGWGFDFIDAHYFYPDGIAAAQIAAETGKPLVITARGTDINLIPNYPRPKKMIVNAANRADAVITVAAALKDELINLGAPAQYITTLRNGVDLEMFAPADRKEIRQKMSLNGPVIASVGHLIDRKGHDLVIKALCDVPDATLLIVGDGEKRAALESQASSLGLATRVRFLGALPHDRLRDVYNAADLLVLASSREGWPNVLLEAMACGTPCVATPVWGSGEVIRAPEAGRLTKDRNPTAIASAIKTILAQPPDRAATRCYAEQHSWDETVDGMAGIFRGLTEKADAANAIKTRPLRASSRDYIPKLIVTVDTEEQFDWSKFDTADHTLNDTSDIDRFQKTCAAATITPLYLLTHPLLTAPEIAAYFRRLHDAGEADCGLHLHQWVTPPGDFLGEYHSYQKNLPREVHRNKLKSLANAFKAVFGTDATAHRAGRYGISPADYELLAEIGIQFDFSPSAGFDFSKTGGPDFSACSNMPFRAATGGGNIFVTPVCGAAAIRRTQLFLSQEHSPPGFALPKRSNKSRFTIPMRLSPEGATLKDLQALTRRLIADKTPVLTFTLHSTTLTAGANGYAGDEQGVQRILDITRQYFEWFGDTVGGQTISLTDLTKFYEGVDDSRSA